MYHGFGDVTGLLLCSWRRSLRQESFAVIARPLSGDVAKRADRTRAQEHAASKPTRLLVMRGARQVVAVTVVLLAVALCVAPARAETAQASGASVDGLSLAPPPIPLESAQPETAKRWHLSFERLVFAGGWTMWRREGQRRTKESGSNWGFMSGAASNNASAQVNPFAVPRLALDYRTSSGLTFGAALGAFSGSSDVDITQGNLAGSATMGAHRLFEAAARVGYLARVNKLVSVWGRGGIVASHQRLTSPIGRSSTTMFDIDVDASFLIDLWGPVAVSTSFALGFPIHDEYKSELNLAYALQNDLASTYHAYSFHMTSYAGHIGSVIRW